MPKTEVVDVDTTEMVDEVHERVDALLQLLIEKGVISEHEYNKKLTELFESKY